MLASRDEESEEVEAWEKAIPSVVPRFVERVESQEHG